MARPRYLEIESYEVNNRALQLGAWLAKHRNLIQHVREVSFLSDLEIDLELCNLVLCAATHKAVLTLEVSHAHALYGTERRFDLRPNQANHHLLSGVQWCLTAELRHGTLIGEGSPGNPAALAHFLVSAGALQCHS